MIPRGISLLTSSSDTTGIESTEYHMICLNTPLLLVNKKHFKFNLKLLMLSDYHMGLSMALIGQSLFRVPLNKVDRTINTVPDSRVCRASLHLLQAENPQLLVLWRPFQIEVSENLMLVAFNDFKSNTN